MHQASYQCLSQELSPLGRVASEGKLSRLQTATTGAVAASTSLLALYERVASVARTTLPVLVLGETGSGKELVARSIHEQSPRCGLPYRIVNCAAIPATLIEGTLFGSERGAFTGADRQTLGLFEQAQGGTVFLDEVAELSLPAQAALLRVLEQKRVSRVGGTKEIELDIRIVAATHRDLGRMVEDGRFRQDLRFRLDGLTLRVPPLRERREEIGPLALHFLNLARQRWSTPAKSFASEAVAVLESYAWPGNVRELRNVVECVSALCQHALITAKDLPDSVYRNLGNADHHPTPPHADASSPPTLPERVRLFEISQIREALELAHGNHAKAAQSLGIPRRTLSNKVQVYGIVSSGGWRSVR